MRNETAEQWGRNRGFGPMAMAMRLVCTKRRTERSCPERMAPQQPRARNKSEPVSPPWFIGWGFHLICVVMVTVCV